MAGDFHKAALFIVPYIFGDLARQATCPAAVKTSPTKATPDLVGPVWTIFRLG